MKDSIVWLKIKFSSCLLKYYYTLRPKESTFSFMKPRMS